MNGFSKITLTFGLGLAIASSFATPGIAQTDDGIYQNSESSGVIGGDENFNPFDLIHNSRLNSGRDSEAFKAESGENIDDAAADYRQSLLEYFRQQKADEAANNTEAETTAP